MLTRKPRVGDEIRCPDEDCGTMRDFGVVIEVGGNLCYVEKPNGVIDVLIWKFSDTLNTYFQIGVGPKKRTERID